MPSRTNLKATFVTAGYGGHRSQWVKSHMEDKEVFELKLCPCKWLTALRSGITVASEVHPRRGYCWLKTFPNTPQDDLKYSRLCNFWRPKPGPERIQKKLNRLRVLTLGRTGGMSTSLHKVFSQKFRKDCLLCEIEAFSSFFYILCANLLALPWQPSK